jgi:hypothetical protein
MPDNVNFVHREQHFCKNHQPSALCFLFYLENAISLSTIGLFAQNVVDGYVRVGI